MTILEPRDLHLIQETGNPLAGPDPAREDFAALAAARDRDVAEIARLRMLLSDLDARLPALTAERNEHRLRADRASGEAEKALKRERARVRDLERQVEELLTSRRWRAGEAVSRVVHLLTFGLLSPRRRR
ncbi:hypothetical protein [Histidinibacterium aquaticum]|uniref:Uncharacterized protein n=1 Tax=Histidinibacterium aquaticum TaxID=2613962 RepID=A0A5J5GJJ4_9RHOB|nr:hypothetical protein [Histidinibacterium aquaticum]KAA9007878.1 hypothetical protein F3S47_10150 [Histidinibacterium aquaticum]